MGMERQWPQHPSPEWRKTLDMARKAGWLLDKHSDHSWGRITCNPDLPRDERCGETVFSTGSGTENVARSTRRKIDRCSHGKQLSESSTAPGDLEAAKKHLCKADRLVIAARQLLFVDQKTQEVEELLSQAEICADSAESLVLKAIVAEEEADAAKSRGLGLAGSEQPEPPNLLNTAEREIDSAAVLVAGPSRGEDEQEIEVRCQQLRDRICELREGFFI